MQPSGVGMLVADRRVLLECIGRAVARDRDSEEELMNTPMRFLPILLLVGCSPASDGVILRGEPLTGLPDAWLSWRALPPATLTGATSTVPPLGGAGLVIYQDGRAEAVTRTPAWGDRGSRTLRRQGTLSASERAELEKALAGPIAAPAASPPRRPRGDLESEGEPEGSDYEVEFRAADGAVRRVRYQHRRWPGGESGGEPLHPLFMRLLKSWSE